MARVALPGIHGSIVWGQAVLEAWQKRSLSTGETGRRGAWQAEHQGTEHRALLLVPLLATRRAVSRGNEPSGPAAHLRQQQWGWTLWWGSPELGVAWGICTPFTTRCRRLQDARGRTHPQLLCSIATNRSPTR